MRRTLYFGLRRWTRGVTQGMAAGLLGRFIASPAGGSLDSNATCSSKEGNTTPPKSQIRRRLRKAKPRLSTQLGMPRASQPHFRNPNTTRATPERVRPNLQRARSWQGRGSDATGFPRVAQGGFVSSSLEVARVEKTMDVEKGFPAAMAHLKSTPTSPHAQQGKEDRKWRSVTHVYNVDGYTFSPSQKEAAEEKERESGPFSAEPSFFDEDSLDIRGGLRDVAAVGPSSLPPTPEEGRSPDVLQLSGGHPRRDGLGLAQRSNHAPADQTVEGDNTENDFGDTPVQITDMLRERLMELKAEKLQEDREETYLPRRLHLVSDAELQRRHQRSQAQQALQVLPKTSKGNFPFASSSLAPLQKRVLTLSDLEEAEKEEKGTGTLSREAELTVSNSLRDGVGTEQQQQAARFLRHTDGYLPGANSSSYELDSKPLDADGFTDDQPSGSPLTDPHAVYLLRVLPRASFCSRREASAIIASGQVRVNNVVERNPFRLIRPEDDVHVLGHNSRLRYAPPRLWMYHKPANVLVSRNDVAGRALISKHARILGMDHLIPVGSLPLRAHGILMLTNDGELSRFLENPKSGIQKTYLLRVRPAIDPILAHKLNTEGININGRQYRNAEFLVNPAVKSRHSVKVKVRGETMHVSQLMQHLGRKIERGSRISFGPFALSTLPVGSLREVTIPPFYTGHLAAVWKPFVERDWPYFRRQRVMRLRQLARFRELTPKEAEELEQYTYEEVHHALSFESQELAAAAEKRAELMQRRPVLASDQALERDFDGSAEWAGAPFIDPGWAAEEGILHDITAAT